MNLASPISSNDCTLESVSSRLEIAPHIRSNLMNQCVLNFFKSCREGPVQAFVKNGDYYQLDHMTIEKRHLKAIGYMLGLAYSNAYYVDMKFDPKFLAYAFTSYIDIANTLPKTSCIAIARSFNERCFDGKIAFESFNYTFYVASNLIDYPFAGVFNRVNTCLEASSFQNLLTSYCSGEVTRQLDMIGGVQSFFSEIQIRSIKSKSDLIENIHQRISATEPVRLRNWWRYGLYFSLSPYDKRMLRSCINSLPQDKLQKLFTIITGVDNMPYGGVARIQTVKFQYSSYSNDFAINLGENTFEVPRYLRCEDFKKNMGID